MMGKKNEAAATRINTIVGENTVFEGVLTTKGTTRIDGVVKGEVKSAGNLIIGAQGRVEGNIEADNILVAGTVKGDMTAKGKIEATSTGKIYGDLITKGLIIDENAIFQGACKMDAEKEKTAGPGPVKGKAADEKAAPGAVS